MYDSCTQWYEDTYEQILQVALFLVLCIYLDLAFCVFFSLSLNYFVLVLFAFVVLGLVSSGLCQEIAWKERPQTNLCCVTWDEKP